jgi:uracil-DNA glycosylase
MHDDDLRAQIEAHLEFYREMGMEFVDLPAGEAATGMDKKKALKDLWENHVDGCTKCPLHHGRNNIVFGEGSADADIMFIGEGPGRDEDIQGRPFVGRAGQKLNDIIHAMGLERDDVYIANIVKCRPPGNRNPETEESETCIPYLREQIRIIAPRVIVALGSVSARNLLNTTTPISKMRGEFYEYMGVPVMPTYHPAYLLRNYTPRTRGEVWSDMQKVMKQVDRNG